MTKYPFEVVSVRLVKDAPLMSATPICHPQDAVRLLGKELCEMDREVVCLINRKTDGTPINCSFISIGALNEALVHPREIMKAAVLSNAASIILIHNHPSGNLSPSKHDTLITERLIMACQIMDITLDDHIIVGGDNSKYFSFHEKGLMTFEPLKLNTDYMKTEFDAPRVEETEMPIQRRGR